MQRVLFTGGRSPATLALLRLFAQAGHHCQVAESLQPNLAGASRYCAKNHRLPPPRQQTEAFIAQLKALLLREKIDLLIPTCEEIFYVSRFMRELESTGCRVFTSSIDLLTHLHSKYQFNQLLRTLKLPAPETERFDKLPQLLARLPEWQAYVLKPEFSRFASQVLIRPQLQQVERLSISPAQPWVVQTFLPGPQFCSYSIAQNGRLRAHAVYPTRYTAGQGATIYFEAIQVPEIEASVAKIVKSLDYTGQISFDFLLSDGLYYPIECNPRTTTGTFLFQPGDQLPNSFLPEQQAIIYAEAAQPVSLSLAMLLYALPQHLLQLPALLRDMHRAQDPLWQLADFAPFLAQFGMLGQTFWRAKRQGLSLLAGSTHDIEWNGFWHES